MYSWLGMFASSSSSGSFVWMYMFFLIKYICCAIFRKRFLNSVNTWKYHRSFELYWLDFIKILLQMRQYLFWNYYCWPACSSEMVYGPVRDWMIRARMANYVLSKNIWCLALPCQCQDHGCWCHSSLRSRAMSSFDFGYAGYIDGNLPKRALPAMLTHDRWGPFGRIPSISAVVFHDYFLFIAILVLIPKCKYVSKCKYVGFIKRFSTLRVNPLRAKFSIGNTNIYLHFVPFLHIHATQVVEILPQIRREPTYST